MDKRKILVTGASGQIGTELLTALYEKYGEKNIIGSDLRPIPALIKNNSRLWQQLDVTKRTEIDTVIRKHKINTIYHMAAILSATGEKKPDLCWNVNINGTINILEAAVDHGISSVIIPSSIAAFGPETPKFDTPQETILRPKTMYGVTKVAGELLCDYYVKRFGIDVRGLRYPGIISSEVLPGGGTTDYAVEIFYKAIEKGTYTCFLDENTVLPMMYMPDCIKATIDLAEADFSRLKHHSDFNVGSMSFSAGELAESIRRFIPDFSITYKPDYRQEIADSWPRSIDDSVAKEEWDWAPEWNLESMTSDMIKKLNARHREGWLYPESE